MTTKALLLALAFSTTALQAGDWPAWRGPGGQGHSEEDVPLEWSETENVKWKVALDQPGHSTPVVFGDRVFLTTAKPKGVVRSLLCLSRKDGSTLWRKDVPYEGKEPSWKPTWYANASAAVDSAKVVVTFGSAGTYCFDHDGKELWKRTDLGTWSHKFGNSSSPVLYGDLAIQWCGPNEKEGRNFLLAVNGNTGKTVWEHDEKYGSWGTPLVVKVDGQDQLLLATGQDKKNEPEPADSYLKGFDPKTGEELWVCRGINSYVYASPLYADGIAVAMSGYMGAAFAVKLGGRGDVTADRLWQHPKNIQRVGSGVIVGEHVYVIEENGVPHCYELKTGEEVWEAGERVGGSTWGSVVHANGRLYCMMKNGETVVLKASPEYEVLAKNSLGKGQSTNASPAFSNGEIFLRTNTHLFCIGE